MGGIDDGLIAERAETAKRGSYRSRDLSLAWISAPITWKPDAEFAR